MYKPAEIAISHTNCRGQAELQGPWTLCFHFPFTWDPMGLTVSKRYSCCNSQPNIFKFVMNFPTNGLHKGTCRLGIFEIFSFQCRMAVFFLLLLLFVYFILFYFFFWKILNSLLYNMDRQKSSIIWKTSYNSAKMSDTLDLYAVV